ncbi:MAG: hypothetical protein AB7O66_20920 [Limisphaerales bacterium]
MATAPSGVVASTRVEYFTSAKPGRFDGFEGHGTQEGGPSTDFGDADVAENVRLQELRAAGECVLDMDDPLQRKQNDQLRERKVRRIEEARRALGQAEMFASLGLSEGQAAQFDRHLSQIVRASAEASMGMAQLQKARSEYAKRIRSTLTAEQAKAYGLFEEKLRVAPDVDAFGKYLAEAKSPVDSDVRGQFAAVVTEAGASTFVSWSGPFDEMPTPAYGADQVIPRLEQELVRITDGGTRALRVAANQGMSPEALDLIRGYFATRLKFIEESIAGARKWGQMSPEDYKFLDGTGPRRHIPER